jgi:acetyltransferase-like isoleucine patch superfamily enzyme
MTHQVERDADPTRAFTFYPVKIADFVNVGPNCIVEAASIGHGVEIGEECIIVGDLETCSARV